jgi:hypothetical protein
MYGCTSEEKGESTPLRREGLQRPRKEQEVVYF